MSRYSCSLEQRNSSAEGECSFALSQQPKGILTRSSLGNGSRQIAISYNKAVIKVQVYRQRESLN